MMIDKIKENFTDSLISLMALGEMLGYEDDRSTKKWCKENEVPTLKLGQKVYVHEWTINMAFLRLYQFETRNQGFDGQAIISAIVNDDKVGLAELLDTPVSDDIKNKFTSNSNDTSIESVISNYKKKAV
jgi:hypothetical protein